MKPFNFDIVITRYSRYSRYIADPIPPRPFFSFARSATVDGYEAHIGPWYVVATRIKGRKHVLGKGKQQQ